MSIIDKESIKQLIVIYVTAVEGCKITDLVTDFPAKQVSHEVLIALGDYDMKTLSDELCKEGRLNKVEYALPSQDLEETEESMKKRARVFLVPKGSMVWEPQDN